MEDFMHGMQTKEVSIAIQHEVEKSHLSQPLAKDESSVTKHETTSDCQIKKTDGSKVAKPVDEGSCQLSTGETVKLDSYISPAQFGVHKQRDIYDTRAHNAASLNNYDDLLEALKQDPSSLNAINQRGHTPLSLAILCSARNEKSECIDYLMKIKEATGFYAICCSSCYFDWDSPELEKTDMTKFKSCISPLTAAIEIMSPELVERLIKAGAPLQYKVMPKNYIFKLLCRAVGRTKVDDIFNRNFNGNLKKVLEVLLNHDREVVFSLSEPHGKNMLNAGLNAIETAVTRGHRVYYLVKLLIDYAKGDELDPHHTDGYGMNIFISTLHCCTANSDLIKLMQVLLENNGYKEALNDICMVKPPYKTQSLSNVNESVRNFTALGYLELTKEYLQEKYDDGLLLDEELLLIEDTFHTEMEAYKAIIKLFKENKAKSVNEEISDQQLVGTHLESSTCSSASESMLNTVAFL